MREREEKEGKKSIEGVDSQDEKSDLEEEEDAGVRGWDRQWAERMFIETKDELAIIGGLYPVDQEVFPS